MLTLALWVLTGSARAGADEGRPIYVAKCQACHGTAGRGDGPAARALPKPPRDFTDPAFWATATDTSVKNAVSQGLPGTIMRGFPMPEPQLNDLVAYLRSLAPAAAPVPAAP